MKYPAIYIIIEFDDKNNNANVMILPSKHRILLLISLDKTVYNMLPAMLATVAAVTRYAAETLSKILSWNPIIATIPIIPAVMPRVKFGIMKLLKIGFLNKFMILFLSNLTLGLVSTSYVPIFFKLLFISAAANISSAPIINIQNITLKYGYLLIKKTIQRLNTIPAIPLITPSTPINILKFSIGIIKYGSLYSKTFLIAMNKVCSIPIIKINKNITNAFKFDIKQSGINVINVNPIIKNNFDIVLIIFVELSAIDENNIVEITFVKLITVTNTLTLLSLIPNSSKNV